MIQFLLAASFMAVQLRAVEPSITAPADTKAPTPETEGLRWANAYIDFLLTVQQSTHRANPNESDGTDVESARRRMLGQITAGKEAMLDLKEAEGFIQPFKKSKQGSIADLVDANCVLLDAVLNQYSRMNKIALAVYDGHMPKDYADRMSDIAAKVNYDWDQYLKIVGMSALGAFQAPKNKNAPYDTLDFSSGKRDELLRRMEKYFGDSVKNSDTAKGRSTVELAPALFYRALSKPDIKFSEQ